MSYGNPVSPKLSAALRAYHEAFGHEVPAEIVAKYSGNAAPLMMEIRQAVALRQPIHAWLARTKAATFPP